MLRTILLLAVIATAMGVYLDKRTDRLGQVTAGPAPIDGSLEPPPALPPRTPPDPQRTAIQGPPTPSEKETGDPLSAMDRESLRDALIDWAPVPPDLIAAEHDREGELEVAFAMFRYPLLASSRQRFGDAPTEPSVSRIVLEDGTTLEIFEPRHEGAKLIGRSPGGLPLELPIETIESIDPLASEEARAAWQAEIERRIGLHLEATDLGERRLAIEYLLLLGERERADSIYSTWIRSGGALALAEELDGPRAERARALARALSTAPLARAPQPTSSAATLQDAPRSLERLATFLSTREGMRRLDDRARMARADECTEWSDWLARRAPQLPLTAKERHRLEEELRLFRYDLLKSGGF